MTRTVAHAGLKRVTRAILLSALVVVGTAGCSGQIIGRNRQPSLTPASVVASGATVRPTALPTSTPTRTPIPSPTATSTPTRTPTATPSPTPTPLVPLAIEAMRQQRYPGSDLIIEQTLDAGSNYDRYVASYLSEGLKIYALLTVPHGQQPASGWPVVVFNHGYIPPAQYRTTERYVAYVDAFARNGYIVIKSDYRGHGSSDGESQGAYGSPAYTVDVLNALASIRRYPGADPDRIGLWGHSMGGYITLRAMVIDKGIKAGVIWGGVVASYPDLMSKWRRSMPIPTDIPRSATRWRDAFVRDYGSPEENPEFWASISANSYLRDLSGPIQLHHSTTDESVPVEFSEALAEEAKLVGADVELFTYPGDNHNISANFGAAMQRSIAFFDQYVKNAAGVP